MSNIILFHEYRKLTATVFTHHPEAELVGKSDLPELKTLLESRIDGTDTVPAPPLDYTTFWEMSDDERLKAGLMVWVEGTDWKMWFMPFEWRFDVGRNKTSHALFYGNGAPFGNLPWNPDAISALFGMMAVGPLTGDIIKYMAESPYILEACHSAGDHNAYRKSRESLVELGSDPECVTRLDRLHFKLVESTAQYSVNR